MIFTGTAHFVNALFINHLISPSVPDPLPGPASGTTTKVKTAPDTIQRPFRPETPCQLFFTHSEKSAAVSRKGGFTHRSQLRGGAVSEKGGFTESSSNFVQNK